MDSSKTLCKNDNGSVESRSDAEMASEEEKSTGDIITLIFKGQKSIKLSVSHFRDKGKTGNFLSCIIKATVHGLNCLVYTEGNHQDAIFLHDHNFLSCLIKPSGRMDDQRMIQSADKNFLRYLNNKKGSNIC